MDLSITIPRRLYEKLVEKGVDVELFISDALPGQVNLDLRMRLKYTHGASGRNK